uniref:hypothetical protein n=1 Tax=Dialister sp. TaxID=1955814 RepID=UPI004027DD4B
MHTYAASFLLIRKRRYCYCLFLPVRKPAALPLLFPCCAPLLFVEKISFIYKTQRSCEEMRIHFFTAPFYFA